MPKNQDSLSQLTPPQVEELVTGTLRRTSDEHMGGGDGMHHPNHNETMPHNGTMSGDDGMHHNDTMMGEGDGTEEGDHVGHGVMGSANNHTTTSTPFCIAGGSSHSAHLGGGMEGGMIMYMDGFRFSLSGNQPCLNLYFPGWTLDTYGKFIAAMIGMFLLAFLTEAISKARFACSSKPTLQGGRRRTSLTALHATQALVGYILMLATMTFSVELLLSVVAGLGVGYATFYDDRDHHVTTNPCCNFIQDETDDRYQHAGINKGVVAGTTTPVMMTCHDGNSCCCQEEDNHSLPESARVAVEDELEC